jgi:single-stranded-DNA-specific exonuclease
MASADEWPDDLHPVLARVYSRRAITTADELDQTFDRLLPYTGLAGIDAAVALLSAALERQQRILIVGDFDADGATSCAVAVRALRLLGARYVDFLVPNRFEFGYGLTPEIVDVAIAQHRPDVIVTVDNGIASVAGVDRARAAGIAVLISDHHLPGAVLPAADVIVNPNQPGDTFASKHLAGVGVIFYVMWALRSRLCASGWFAGGEAAAPKLGVLLDLVALGTVADVVRLDHNNRILVAQGLRRIRAGRACAGIRALMTVSKRQVSRLVAADMGFALGPRLNAAGRLDDMTLGIQCLLTDDDDTAIAIARQLDDMNRQRRLIEAEMQEQALAIVDGLAIADEQRLPFGLCLYDRSWHQGVVGLLAGRIKERFHRPVIAFAPGDAGQLKGSARSVPGLHIRDVLDAIAARHPALLSKFGGHAMAAGLTLNEEDFEAFSRAFDLEVREHLSDDDLRGVIFTDGQLALTEFSLELAELLRNGGPWGQGFPEPVFDGTFSIRDARVVGDNHLKLTLEPDPAADLAIDAIAFNTAADRLPEDGAPVQCAYRLDVNDFRGRRQLQMIIEHIEPA